MPKPDEVERRHVDAAKAWRRFAWPCHPPAWTASNREPRETAWTTHYVLALPTPMIFLHVGQMNMYS